MRKGEEKNEVDGGREWKRRWWKRRVRGRERDGEGEGEEKNKGDGGGGEEEEGGVKE